MSEAIEVSSISLNGLGNPFFSDASFSGADPVNSKTCKELIASGEIKSFRGKFQASGDGDSSLLVVGVSSSKCRTRFYGKDIAQQDIEEFSKRKLVVISAVGTKEYYRNRGYSDDGAYVSKLLL